MPFRKLRFDPSDATGHPWSYQWMRWALPRVPVFSALFDEARGLTFYRVFVNSCEERPPGLCLLFVGDRPPVVIEMWEQHSRTGQRILDVHGRELTGEGIVLTLLLYAMEIPEGVTVTREEVMDIVMEVFKHEQAQRNLDFSPVRIHWAFQRGSEESRPAHRFPL